MSTSITSRGYVFDTRTGSPGETIMPHDYPIIAKTRIDCPGLPANSRVRSASYNVIHGHAPLLKFYMLLLLAAALWPASVEAATASASKDCTFSPCTIDPVMATPIVIIGTPKILHWEANYTGSPTQG